MTLRWVLPSGLRSFVANLLVGLTVALAVTTSVLLGAVGLLVFLASLPRPDLRARPDRLLGARDL